EVAFSGMGTRSWCQLHDPGVYSKRCSDGSRKEAHTEDRVLASGYNDLCSPHGRGFQLRRTATTNPIAWDCTGSRIPALCLQSCATYRSRRLCPQFLLGPDG